MKTLLRTIFCALFLAGWGLAALSLHVVRTPTSISLVPKDHLGVVDTYVDTRHWTTADLADHPLVVNRIIETNQNELLRHVTGHDGADLQRDLKKATANAPRESSVVNTVRHTVADAAASSSKEWWSLR